jgi:D-glycero-alpha-D-manno-heptose-7-phosphate kinase
MRYRARAPLRIDFGGGWTDVPFYAEEHGGAVLNAAITQYAHGFIDQESGTPWLKGLRRSGSRVSYAVDVPPGSGLGTSAAQTVLWVALVKTTVANVSERCEIAEIACQMARLLGIVGGKQDEYASALGGITYFTFRDTVEAERLELDRAFAEELRSRLVLVYTGASRLSGSIHERVWTRYRQGETGVISALHRLRAIADEMRGALVTQQLDAFGRLLSENWDCQKALDPSVSYRELDGVMSLAAAHGALGGKACGAGGGGCLVFLAGEGQTDRVRAAVSQAGLRTIDVDFDSYGIHLRRA